VGGGEVAQRSALGARLVEAGELATVGDLYCPAVVDRLSVDASAGMASLLGGELFWD
jgi:hypothetical protein